MSVQTAGRSLEVTCPKCKRGPDQQCRSTSGGSTALHTARREAWLAWRYGGGQDEEQA